MPRAGIALGSNLGNRAENIQEAIRRLRAAADPAEPFLEAAIEETEPERCPPGSPPFLNTVVEIGYAGTAFELLRITRAIESTLARTRGPERNAPRTIDLDLLYFSDEIHNLPELILPHPRLAERRFVLGPLSRIRPDLILPGGRKTVGEMLAELVSRNPE